MANYRSTVIVFNKNPVAFIDLTSEGDSDCDESGIDYVRALRVPVIVQPPVEMASESNGDNDGTTQVICHADTDEGKAFSCLDNIANAVEALHLTEENVSHSAPDSAIEVEMKAITYAANDYAIPVSFHQMNTDLLDRAATIQNEASTTSIGAFAEQTNDPVNDCITGGVSADALPQCRVMLTDCAKELKKPSGCPACRRNFMTKGDQTQHINDNDTFAPYGCSVECPKMLSCLIDSKGLCEKRIYHDHRTQIQYKCRKCPKMYGNNCSLLRHVLAVHLRTRRKRKHLRKVCRSWRKG